MKIDKVIFSCSESFGVFWNLNSKIYKTKLNIEPICLLFGKKSNTEMNEDYGKIIEMPILENIPLIIQITWSKFYHPIYEPEKTWMIGDIDLMPLQKFWFTDNLLNIDEDNYVHLDANGITQISNYPFSWLNDNLNESNIPKAMHHECNLPGHYHVAKGEIFKKTLNHYGNLEEELIYISNSGKYNGDRGYRESDPLKDLRLWCAEEKRSTELIKTAIINKIIKFKGFSIKNGLGRADGDRIDRSTLRDEESGQIINPDYLYEKSRLENGGYVDLHCARPFKTFYSQTENVLKLAKMIEE